jgi:5-oxoprolinase (ATP-hydrolysing) subunit A
MTLHLNADMGERGMADVVDLALLPMLNQINVAVGGHAGNAAIAHDLWLRASDLGIAVAIHPSYPDVESFGRRESPIAWEDLAASLDHQRAILPTCTQLKFHGALYNRADRDDVYAAQLLSWCKTAGITHITAPPDGCQARAATAHGIAVLREGFADRAYQHADGRLGLVPRDQAGAVFSDGDKAAAQIRQVLMHGRLHTRTGPWPFACDTWCVHSDTPGSIAIVERLRTEWPQ